MHCLPNIKNKVYIYKINGLVILNFFLWFENGVDIPIAEIGKISENVKKKIKIICS